MAHTGSENNANSTVMRSNSRKVCRICSGKNSKYFTIVTVSSIWPRIHNYIPKLVYVAHLSKSDVIL